MTEEEFKKTINNLEEKRVWATGWLKTATRRDSGADCKAYWETIIADVDTAISAEKRSFFKKDQ